VRAARSLRSGKNAIWPECGDHFKETGALSRRHGAGRAFYIGFQSRQSRAATFGPPTRNDRRGSRGAANLRRLFQPTRTGIRIRVASFVTGMETTASIEEKRHSMYRTKLGTWIKDVARSSRRDSARRAVHDRSWVEAPPEWARCAKPNRPREPPEFNGTVYSCDATTLFGRKESPNPTQRPTTEFRQRRDLLLVATRLGKGMSRCFAENRRRAARKRTRRKGETMER